MAELRRTALIDAHRESGAKLVDFAGWEMPVQYDGVIAESQSVRRSAGMFDVSHMGRTWFRGENVREYLDMMTTNDVGKLEDGGSQYSLLCYDNGTCVDDIYMYRISADVFRIVINASNREKDLDWFRSHNDREIAVVDETLETAMIAVQGPMAVPIVDRLAGEQVSDMPKFATGTFSIGDVEVFGARTGYTGEDGFELIMPAHDADKVWAQLLAAGVKPCGLAARDVLRVEAGLPLYGHELSEGINPIETGLGWVCSKTKRYIGSDRINEMREAGPSRKLVGIIMDSKMLPREGYEVCRNGARVGTITSGVYSPVFERGIAFAFVDAEHATLDMPCEVIVRESPQPARIVSKRFLKQTEKV